MGVSEFVLAALLLELTPGPNMAYLATLSLARGRASGFAATTGVAFGLSVHAILAALGAGVLIQRFALIYEVLRWTGVAYLLVLAWEGWQSQAESSPSRADLRSTVSPLFLRGFLSNIFNPKSIIFFVSVVPRFVETEPGRFSDTDTNDRAGKPVCRHSHNDTCDHRHDGGSVETVACGWAAAGCHAPNFVPRSRPSGRLAGLDYETLSSVSFSCDEGALRLESASRWTGCATDFPRGAARNPFRRRRGLAIAPAMKIALARVCSCLRKSASSARPRHRCAGGVPRGVISAPHENSSASAPRRNVCDRGSASLLTLSGSSFKRT
jgi:hypothetical protein